MPAINYSDALQKTIAEKSKKARGCPAGQIILEGFYDRYLDVVLAKNLAAEADFLEQ